MTRYLPLWKRFNYAEPAALERPVHAGMGIRRGIIRQSALWPTSSDFVWNWLMLTQGFYGHFEAVRKSWINLAKIFIGR